MTIPPLVVKQPCGIARLVAAVTGVSVERAFEVTGLELCPRCGKAATNPRYYPYCGSPHKGLGHARGPVVSLRCDECDVLFERRQSDIMKWARRSGQKIFCGRPCLGKYVGRTYGVSALQAYQGRTQSHCKRGHPLSGPNLYVDPSGKHQCRACRAQRSRESSARHKREPRPPRLAHGYKHDWPAIWKAHQDTGYGEQRLGRLLGIPAQSVGNVLRYYRRQSAALGNLTP